MFGFQGKYLLKILTLMHLLKLLVEEVQHFLLIQQNGLLQSHMELLLD